LLIIAPEHHSLMNDDDTDTYKLSKCRFPFCQVAMHMLRWCGPVYHECMYNTSIDQNIFHALQYTRYVSLSPISVDW